MHCLEEHYNADPVYLRHENQNKAYDFRVKLYFLLNYMCALSF